ncbi:hypothetical protein CsSME_00010943 [Camellia sinensis var. sinensis]
MASIRIPPCTQSKNKGIAPEKSSSVEETHKQLKYKASWDNGSIQIFLHLIANEITKGKSAIPSPKPSWRSVRDWL